MNVENSEVQKSLEWIGELLGGLSVNNHVAILSLGIASISLWVSWISRKYLVPKIVLCKYALVLQKSSFDDFQNKPKWKNSQSLKVTLTFTASNRRGGGGGFLIPELLLKKRKYWFAPGKTVAKFSANRTEYKTRQSGKNIEISETIELPKSYYLKGGEVQNISLDYYIYERENKAISLLVDSYTGKDPVCFWQAKYRTHHASPKKVRLSLTMK